MSKQTEHIVFVGDTRVCKSGNGWLYYFCYTCNVRTIHAGERKSDEHWAQVVADFNKEHPHTEKHEAAWI